MPPRPGWSARCLTSSRAPSAARWSSAGSLFDYADEVSRAVPQSCRRTGRCRECVVEVRQGAREPVAAHRRPRRTCAGGFRLACQADDRGDRRRRRVRDHPPPDAHPRVDASRRPTRLDPVVTADDLAVRYGGQPIDLRREPRPRAGDRHRHDDRRVPAHRPADRRGRRRRRAREPAALRRQRRHDPDLVREGFPGRDAAGRCGAALNHELRDLYREHGHRPARGLRGDRRRQQHDARPVLRHRRRARSASSRTSRCTELAMLAGRTRLDLAAPARPRGRAADEPARPRGRRAAHRQPRRRRTPRRTSSPSTSRAARASGCSSTSAPTPRSW